MFDGNVADADCRRLGTLARAGMVLVGHTHTHEFAAGTSTDQVGNPAGAGPIGRRLERRIGGGTRGGMVPAALGTDTGGSLRIPAAFCGVSSVKPTHGRIPVDGVEPLASSLDHVGRWRARSPTAALCCDALVAGGAQTTSLMPPPAPLEDLPTTPRAGPQPMRGLRVALTDRTTGSRSRPTSARARDRARDACTRLGAQVDGDQPPPAQVQASISGRSCSRRSPHTMRATLSAKRSLPSLDRRVRRIRGAGISSAADYIAAQAAAARATAAWEGGSWNTRIDTVLEPTVPTTAHLRGHGYESGRLTRPGRARQRVHVDMEPHRPPGRRSPRRARDAIQAAGRRVLVAPRGHEAHSCRPRSICKPTRCRPTSETDGRVERRDRAHGLPRRRGVDGSVAPALIRPLGRRSRSTLQAVVVRPRVAPGPAGRRSGRTPHGHETPIAGSGVSGGGTDAEPARTAAPRRLERARGERARAIRRRSAHGDVTRHGRPRRTPDRVGRARAVGGAARSLSGALVRPARGRLRRREAGLRPALRSAAPAAIAYCASNADVQRAIDFCRRHALAPIPRCGGHSYGGYSTGSGLVIDVSPMNGVHVSRRATATVGAGTRLVDLYSGVAAAGRARAGRQLPDASASRGSRSAAATACSRAATA